MSPINRKQTGLMSANVTNASDRDRELCTLCPRNCRVRRGAGEYGYCRTGLVYNITSICIHRGEEPPVSGEAGICNVFFTHCNLQCIFCQNYQISQNKSDHPECLMELPDIINRIEKILDRGVRGVGFVSPSHCIPQMRKIIRALRGRGRYPFFVMNTNGYDRKETIESLKEEVDLYLPDLKYMDSDLAERYSGAPDYPEIAAVALKEMFRQKGSRLVGNPNGRGHAGLIIRHLVLPGEVENSKACLRFIAKELSSNVHISLMAQYHPIPRVRDHPTLGRTLHREEYEEVREEMVRLGFQQGWVQELESHGSYLPDFNQVNVFVGTGNGGVDGVAKVRSELK